MAPRERSWASPQVEDGDRFGSGGGVNRRDSDGRSMRRNWRDEHEEPTRRGGVGRRRNASFDEDDEAQAPQVPRRRFVDDDEEDLDGMIADLKRKTTGRDMYGVLRRIEEGEGDAGASYPRYDDFSNGAGNIERRNWRQIDDDDIDRFGGDGQRYNSRSSRERSDQTGEGGKRSYYSRMRTPSHMSRFDDE